MFWKSMSLSINRRGSGDPVPSTKQLNRRICTFLSWNQTNFQLSWGRRILDTQIRFCPKMMEHIDENGIPFNAPNSTRISWCSSCVYLPSDLTIFGQSPNRNVQEISFWTTPTYPNIPWLFVALSLRQPLLSLHLPQRSSRQILQDW